MPSSHHLNVCAPPTLAAVGSVFINVTSFEEKLVVVGTKARRRSSIGELLKESLESEAPSAARRLSDTVKAATSATAGRSFTKRKATLEDNGPLQRGSTMTNLKGGWGLARARFVRTWGSGGGTQGGFETPGAAPSGSPAGRRFDATSVAFDFEAMGNGSSALSAEARIQEERMAAEVRLHTMWRLQMHDCPGLEAEVAKLHASETAKHILREWEAEQDVLKQQQRAAKEVKSSGRARTRTAKSQQLSQSYPRCCSAACTCRCQISPCTRRRPLLCSWVVLACVHPLLRSFCIKQRWRREPRRSELPPIERSARRTTGQKPSLLGTQRPGRARRAFQTRRRVAHQQTPPSPQRAAPSPQRSQIVGLHRL